MEGDMQRGMRASLDPQPGGAALLDRLYEDHRVVSDRAVDSSPMAIHAGMHSGSRYWRRSCEMLCAVSRTSRLHFPRRCGNSQRVLPVFESISKGPWAEVSSVTT